MNTITNAFLNYNQLKNVIVSNETILKVKFIQIILIRKGFSPPIG